MTTQIIKLKHSQVSFIDHTYLKYGCIYRHFTKSVNILPFNYVTLQVLAHRLKVNSKKPFQEATVHVQYGVVNLGKVGI